jgi:hypothetical protein
MLSSVLNSRRAVQVNIAIVRTFVRLRELLSSHQDLAQRLDELERNYDEKFRVVFEAIRQLMAPPPAPKKRRIVAGKNVPVPFVHATRHCPSPDQRSEAIRPLRQDDRVLLRSGARRARCISRIRRPVDPRSSRF